MPWGLRGPLQEEACVTGMQASACRFRYSRLSVFLSLLPFLFWRQDCMVGPSAFQPLCPLDEESKSVGFHLFQNFLCCAQTLFFSTTKAQELVRAPVDNVVPGAE